MISRKLTLKQAIARYVHRFTMDHVPQWAQRPHKGRYYAPQFRSDKEWYQHTRFEGEEGYLGLHGDCYTRGSTWPLGSWLNAPYKRGNTK